MTHFDRFQANQAIQELESTAELKQRYEDHLADLVKGKDPARVRLVVE